MAQIIQKFYEAEAYYKVKTYLTAIEFENLVFNKL